jgi:hypothetical protein
VAEQLVVIALAPIDGVDVVGRLPIEFMSPREVRSWTPVQRSAHTLSPARRWYRGRRQ